MPTHTVVSTLTNLIPGPRKRSLPSSTEIRLRHIHVSTDARFGVSIVLASAAQAPLRAPVPEEALALAFVVAVLARLAEALRARGTDLGCLPDALLHFFSFPSEPAESFAAAICKDLGEGAGAATPAKLLHLSLIRQRALPPLTLLPERTHLTP